MFARRLRLSIACAIVWASPACDKDTSETSEPSSATASPKMASKSTPPTDASAATGAKKTDVAPLPTPQKKVAEPVPPTRTPELDKETAATASSDTKGDVAAARTPVSASDAVVQPSTDRVDAAPTDSASRTAAAAPVSDAATQPQPTKDASNGGPSAAEKAASSKDADATKTADPQTPPSPTGQKTSAPKPPDGAITTAQKRPESPPTDRAEASSANAVEAPPKQPPTVAHPRPDSDGGRSESPSTKSDAAAPPSATIPKPGPKPNADAKPPGSVPRATRLLGPGLYEGATVWVLSAVAPARWSEGKVTGTCGHAQYEVALKGPQTVCMSGAIIAAPVAQGATFEPGQRVVIRDEGELMTAGTVQRASNDALIRRDRDGADVAVAFDWMRVLGVGTPLAPAETLKGENVWAQSKDGHFRRAIRQEPCAGGAWALVAPDTRQCLAKMQLAPDRYVRSLEVGARVLQIPKLGDKDAWAGTVVAVSEDTIRVLRDGAEAREVPLKKLRLLAGPGQLGEPVVHEAKRCAKLNLRNKAFNARGTVGFRFKNRCLRPIKCQMNIEYYCAHDESDSKSEWFACDRFAAPGETLTCADKRCRRPRRGDEATYRAIRCSFSSSP